MSLVEYKRKRDFSKTAEPRGEVKRTAKHRFVIQKHEASHLLYDFRLELGGTLKSWAVPKGPPYAKGEKRLAMQVEDHPNSYIDFEGTIPKGQYGGGTVMVWDQGTYEPLSDDPLKELESGKLHFVLSGKKLKGEWYLVRLKDEKQWLLIRAKDDMKSLSAKMDDTSAVSGRSMKEISGGDKVWQSNRAVTVKPSRLALKKKQIAAPLEVKFIEPMKARLVETPPSGDWIYEIKLDGFRALAYKREDQVRLLSRNEKDFNAKFPEVAEAVGELAADDFIMDGEIVALDNKGRSSFQLLQAYDIGEERPPIFYYIFDLLKVNGKDLRRQPLEERKSALETILKKAPGALRFSPSLQGDPDILLRKVGKLGLEGLIGKRRDSTYETGQRSGAWVKLKLHQEQEFVIGGYTPPQGGRQHFGSLLVGYNDEGGLHYCGKVGTGFDEALLKLLSAKMEAQLLEKCPFSNLPETKASRYSVGLTAAEMRRCHWVKPTLVSQLKFSEWTRDGKLRQPVFLGLREDKDASEVVREIAK